jgi:hypothetical protein
MTDTIDYISSATDRIFRQDPTKLAVAKKHLTAYSGNIATLLPKLDKLCNCDFFLLANLQNIIPSQTVVETINTALTSNGDVAVNTNAYIPAGTLGSFYECTSLTDTNPTLIASGKNTLSEMATEQQKCVIWAFPKLAVNTASPNSAAHPDYGDYIRFGNGGDNGPSVAPVYASFSSDGGCFSITENNINFYSTAMAADSKLICLYALDH